MAWVGFLIPEPEPSSPIAQRDGERLEERERGSDSERDRERSYSSIAVPVIPLLSQAQSPAWEPLFIGV